MILRSGKYKGKKWTDVQTYDPGYIQWVRENRPEMLKSQKTTVKEEDYSYLDEIEDFRKLKTLQHTLFRNPTKPEDAF
jgi:hypothetical protein